MNTYFMGYVKTEEILKYIHNYNFNRYMYMNQQLIVIIFVYFKLL